MRALLTLLALVSLPVPLPVLAAGLNDTGVTQCLNTAGTALETCSAANTGNAAAYPRQDARFGRDAAQAAGQLPAKTGGGAAGFDFTPLDAAGNVITLTTGTPPVPSATPICTHDNVTNLTWEVKTAANYSSAYTFAQAATYASTINTASLCGTANWRVPTRRELLSIVHLGTNNPPIDTNYFPNTPGEWFWTSDIYAPDSTKAWGVWFNDGAAEAKSNSSYFRVRLVRSGQ